MTPLRATVLIALMGLLSKLLGLVRQMVFAHALGAGAEVDIYVAAFRIPDLLFSLLILGTLSVAFIPVFVEYLSRDHWQAFTLASTIFNLTFIGMAVLGVVGFFVAPWFVQILVPGFDQVAKMQTVTLTRILLLSPLLFSLSTVLTSILHSFQRFFLAALAPLFYNFALILGIIFWYPRWGLKGIVWGAVLGAFLHLLIQVPSAVRLGLKPFRYLLLHHEGVRKVLKLFIPRIFGIDLGQVSLLVASVLGSSLGAGSLAVFYYGYDLNMVPLGIFAISFAVASFPTMAKYFTKKDLAGFKSFFAKTAVQVLFLIIPISVLLLLLRAQIVRLIFGAGEGTQFTFTDTKLTAQTLGFFALSLFAQSLVPLLARAFYALQNTVIPVVSGLLASGVNILLAYVFTRFWEAPSIALAFSIAITLHMLIMLAILHRRLRGLDDDFLLIRIIKISVASVMMGITAYLTLYAVAPLVNMQTYVGILIQTFSALTVASVTYLLSGLLIKLQETRQLMDILRAWFFKFTRSFSSAITDMFTDLR